MSKELIGKIRDELSDGGVMVAPYWAELFKESAEALETQAREIERLRMQLVACGVVALANTPESAAKARDMHPDYMSASCGDVIRTVDIQMQLRAELAALKSKPSGMVLPERKTWNQVTGREGFIETEAHNACLDEVARLNSSPASAGGPVYQFQCREIGEGDWEPCDHSRYMYCQKSPEMDTRVVQVQALSAPDHSEQVREGWQLVPVEPTEVMQTSAGRDDAFCHCCGYDNGGGDPAQVWREMLAAAPSAGSQEQGE